jgi:hypothetical protein
VDEEVALFESVVDEAEGLLEVRGHLVAGDVEGVDDLVVDAVLLAVLHAEHGGRGEDCVGREVPDLMSFCLRRGTFVAAK